MNSQKKDFEILSQEYLILLGEKSRRAESNQKIAHELSILDMFYEGTRSIIDRYENEIHLLRLEKIGLQAHSRIIHKIHMNEFKNELLKSVNEPPIPSPSQWELIKKKRKKGVSITEITNHFTLDREQIIELSDVK